VAGWFLSEEAALWEADEPDLGKCSANIGLGSRGWDDTGAGGNRNSTFNHPGDGQLAYVAHAERSVRGVPHPPDLPTEWINKPPAGGASVITDPKLSQGLDRRRTPRPL
jgi:hypothetical protein